MQYIETVRMFFRQQLGGGIRHLLARRLLEVVGIVPLMYLWRTLLGTGAAAQAGATLAQMMTYTYLNALLTDVLNVYTPATDAFFEGRIISLYERPMGVFGQLIAETIGGWLPRLVFFSLPMALAAPLLGISLRPASAWAFASLLLTVSLGFAVDLLFACVMIRMRNAVWLVHTIRISLAALFSGAVVPFALLPWGLGNVLASLPLGSLAGAPLSLYVGLAEPFGVISRQLFWNAVLWPAALWWFAASRERMVSFGG